MAVGNVVENLVDNVRLLLSSDTSLESLKEIDLCVKQNKIDLESIDLSKITGLEESLASKVDVADIVDNLLSTLANAPLSANQGKVLAEKIDIVSESIEAIKTVLASDDTTLDELQEIVNFIKQNKEDLSTLDLSNIAETSELKHFTQELKEKVETIDNKIDISKIDVYEKPNSGETLFIKNSPSSISIPKGFIVKVNNILVETTSDFILDLNINLDIGSKVPGTDYYVYAKSDSSFYISADKTITADRLIGGFHYGLTPEDEVLPAAALKVEADMVTSRGIKAYSFWDLTWKPSNKRPEGKVLINNLFWRDIYPADEEYAIRGYSSCFAMDGVTPAKLAGGAETNGRKFPKVPLSKGGDGTINYGSLTWYESNEIVSEVGMRMISYDEFSNSSYGVVEEQSLEMLGYATGTGVIQHYPEFESKWGVEMAVGVQYIWGSQIMNGYGTTDFSHRLGLTDGRGSLYSTSNSPVATRLGGYELGTSTTSVPGSRYVNLSSYVWYTYWDNGFTAVCDHMCLDK